MKNPNKTTGIILISLCFASMVSTDLIVHAESSDEKAKLTPEQQRDLQPMFSENVWRLTSEQRAAAQDSYLQFNQQQVNAPGKTKPSISNLVAPIDPFTIQNRAVSRGGEK
jgi:hypothetical protein